MQTFLYKERDLQLEYKIILHFKGLFDFFFPVIHFQIEKIKYELGWDNLCTVSLLGQSIPDV